MKASVRWARLPKLFERSAFARVTIASSLNVPSLPKLTSQIITLLSKSQSRGMVLEHLGQAASRMYVLRSYTTNSDADEDSITIHGREFPYVSHGEFNHTVLEEVTA